MIYVVFSAIIASLYVALQLKFTYTWRWLLKFEGETIHPIKSRLAILVPVRNEAQSIEACIEALLAQDFPISDLEILVLDNHSHDRTAEIASRLAGGHLKLIRLADHLEENQTFKKEALAFGINYTKADWILTTDGDCLPPPKWASTMLQYALKKRLDMVVGSVRMRTQGTFIENYQALDTAGLMVITAAGLRSNLLISGNGANFLFRKRVFEYLDGYQDNQQHRSGDDLFLLQKFHREAPKQIGFVKDMNATVLTRAETTWGSFFRQRLRWASKSKFLPHQSTRYISILVFLNSFVVLSHLLLIPFFGKAMIAMFITHFLAKIAADSFLLYHATKHFDLTFRNRDWYLSALLNPLYIVSIGLAVLFGPRPIWKNRSI